ncbi:MAG: AlpA family phage regulatory protein [Gallionella sp.]
METQRKILRYIRRPEVLEKTNVSATTIYNMEKAGSFPKHIMLTPRCAAWPEAAVDAWLEGRGAANVKPTPPPDVKKRRTAKGKQKRDAAHGVGGTA